MQGAIAESVARRYLEPIFERDPQIDTLLLGCTHFPVLVDALRAVIPANVAIVDSAQTTAASLHADLLAQNLLRDRKNGGVVLFLATDGPERFARVGSLFLGQPVTPSEVELVDLSTPTHDAVG